MGLIDGLDVSHLKTEDKAFFINRHVTVSPSDLGHWMAVSKLDRVHKTISY